MSINIMINHHFQNRKHQSMSIMVICAIIDISCAEFFFSVLWYRLNRQKWIQYLWHNVLHCRTMHRVTDWNHQYWAVSKPVLWCRINLKAILWATQSNYLMLIWHKPMYVCNLNVITNRTQRIGTNLKPNAKLKIESSPQEK